MEVVTNQSEDRSAIATLMRWVLLTGNRLLLSLIILLGIGVLFVVAGIFGLVTVTASSRMMWYLNGTVNGLLTLVPIAVGVNQIVLSQEFGSIQDFYERRDAITEFRERIEQQTGTTTSSPHASVLFSTLLTTVSDTAHTLQQEHDHSRMDTQTRNELERVTRSIENQADRTNEQLTDRDTDMLESFIIMLGYDDSGHANKVRQFQTELSDFSEDTTESLNQLEDLFIEIDAVRQFLKTVVVERQLARLSLFLIFTGIPAVTVAVFGIFVYRDIPGLTVSHPALVFVASTFIILTLAPLVILGTYIMRVATIARQTAMYSPFIPESNQ